MARIGGTLHQLSVPADALIADLAGSQHGVVTRRQLLELGVTADALRHRLRSDRLHRLHPGVYAVGHRALGRDGDLLALLLACGPTAFLGARTALAFHRVLEDRRTSCDVVLPGRGGTRGPDRAIVSRMGTVDWRDVAVVRGIRVATVARALVDAAGALDDRSLAKTIAEADYLRVLDRRAVDAALTRTPNRPGAARLRRALGEDERVLSREEFILLYLELCDRHGLQRPQVDVRLDTGRPSPGQADLVYLDERVIIELDGAKAHLTRHRFEEDRRRDAYLTAHDWITLRFTWRRITSDDHAVASEVAAVLARRRHG